MSSYKPGEFLTEAIHIVNQEGDTLDISGQVAGVRLFESIHKKFITGDVSVLDGLNLLKNFRFTGQEFIRISIRQKEGLRDDEFSIRHDSIDKTFRIYKVSSIDRQVGTIQSYLLKICDPAMFSAKRTRLSKTLRGSYSDMLGQVMMDHCNIKAKEIDNWEDSVPPNQQFIVPNWNITKFIDFVCMNANKGNEASYRNGMFFYQTLNGGFRFRSIDTMFSEEFPVDFSYSPRSAAETEGMTLNETGGLNSQITKIRRPQLFDTLRGTMGGAYASSAKVYDPIRKIEADINFDMEETFDRGGAHVSGVPMIRTSKMLENEQERMLSTNNMTDPAVSPTFNEIGVDLPPNKSNTAVVIYDYTSNHDFDNSNDITSDSVFKGQTFKTNGLLERRALLEILQQNRIRVTIPLRTDLSVGTIINLLIPEPELYTEESTPKDKVNDHRYLIVDLCVSADITKSSGVLHLECVKESYAKDISKATPLDDASAAMEI